MTRSPRVRLDDIAAACEAIADYMRDDPSLERGVVFDAVRMRLVEIGEAVKDLSDEVLVTAPEVPWRDIARMRDIVAHRYFDTTHAVVAATARRDVPMLRAAVARLLAEL